MKKTVQNKQNIGIGIYFFILNWFFSPVYIDRKSSNCGKINIVCHNKITFCPYQWPNAHYPSKLTIRPKKRMENC